MPEHDFESGDVFITPNGPIRIVSTTYGEIRVTDPTCSHPQDARSGEWEIDHKLLERELDNPESGVGWARLEVITS